MTYIDDSDPACRKIGSWGTTTEPGRYYKDNHSFAKGGNGADTACVYV